MWPHVNAAEATDALFLSCEQTGGFNNAFELPRDRALSPNLPLFFFITSELHHIFFSIVGGLRKKIGGGRQAMRYGRERRRGDGGGRPNLYGRCGRRRERQRRGAREGEEDEERGNRGGEDGQSVTRYRAPFNKLYKNVDSIGFLLGSDSTNIVALHVCTIDLYK